MLSFSLPLLNFFQQGLLVENVREVVVVFVEDEEIVGSDCKSSPAVFFVEEEEKLYDFSSSSANRSLKFPILCELSWSSQTSRGNWKNEKKAASNTHRGRAGYY